MENKSEFRITPVMILGFLIILVGGALLLDNFGVFHLDDYLEWWPVALVLLGVAQIRTSGGGFSGFIGLVLVFGGGLLLLNNLGYLADWQVRQSWPIVLVLFGVFLAWRAFRPAERPKKDKSEQKVSSGRGTTVNGLVVMGGQERELHARDFRGGNLIALMGGHDVDLRHADIDRDVAVINTLSIMGGADFVVPEDWDVQLEIVPIMGAAVNKTRSTGSPGRKKLIVRGLALMGGVEIVTAKQRDKKKDDDEEETEA